MIISHTSPSTSHRWTTRFTVSLSAMIALFGTWGWLTHYGLLPRELALVAGGVLMAGVCLVAQGVCNNMAVEARRARARGLKWSFCGALVVALGFGAVSAMGLHHGWEIAKAVAPTVGVTPPPDWLMTTLFVFIAFGEPVSFWIVEAVRSVGDQPQAATSKPPVDAPSKKARGWSPRLVESGAVGAVAAAALAMGGSADAVAQPAATRSWLGEVATTGSEISQGPDNRAKALADSGWSERRIATELGVSRHAVRRALGRARLERGTA